MDSVKLTDKQVSTHSRLKAAGSPAHCRGLRRWVSTHSRLKAAGQQTRQATRYSRGFNTQPPEGGWIARRSMAASCNIVSTHSRLKAAGIAKGIKDKSLDVSTHSRLKAAGSSVGLSLSGR